MILLLLALPALQGSASQLERLHPPSTVLHVDVPDVPALLEAYAEAPVVRMLRDEEVRSSVEGLLRSSGQSVDTALAGVLEGLGLPAGALSAASGGLRSVRNLSVSLSLELDPGQLETLRQQQQALEGLHAIQVLLDGHVAQHGERPAELDALQLPEPLRADAWGHPYRYETAPPPGASGLLSTGADGAPGGDGADRDLAPEDRQTWAAGLLARHAGFLAVLELADPATADTVFEALLAQLTSRGAEPSDPLALQFDGEAARRARWAPWSGAEAWILQAGARVLVGAGATLPERVEQRLRSKAQSLADAPALRDVRARLPHSAGVTVLDARMDLEGLRPLLDLLAPDQAEDLGSLLARAALRIRLDGGRFVTDAIVDRSTSEPGILASFATQPLPQGVWSWIPADAVGVGAATWEPRALLAQVLERLGQEGGDGDALRELEQRHRFSLQRDIGASLDSSVAVYLLPVSALLSPPPLVVVVGVRDAAALRRGLDGLLALLQEQGAGAFEIRSRPYRDVPMWTLHLAQQGGFGAAMVTPSLALLERQLVLTLSSTRAKKEIQRLLAGNEAVHPWIASARKPPAEACLAGYLDWGALLTGLYTGARGLLAMASGFAGAQAPIEVTALPEAETFVRFFEPTVLWSRPLEGARLLHVESSFGPETWLGIAGLGAGAAAKARSAPERPRILLAGEPPHVEGERATRDTLELLRTRLAVYRIENGRYPEGLAALVEPSAKYPRGYLDGPELPRDAWGRDFHYRSEAGGASHALWSAGANGIDEQGGGDDLRP